MDPIQVSTIGFTKTTAESFFKRLQDAGIRKVLDVRLRNTSQLAGFAKSDDLAFFLKSIGGLQYSHQPLLAPTDAMLGAYKKEKGSWKTYEDGFLALMTERQVENKFSPGMLDGTCLLCSEATPHQCHRRLVCDYLNAKWNGSITVRHL